MMCRNVTLLPVPLRPKKAKSSGSRNGECHIVEHFPMPKRLRHVLEPHSDIKTRGLLGRHIGARSVGEVGDCRRAVHAETGG